MIRLMLFNNCSITSSNRCVNSRLSFGEIKDEIAHLLLGEFKF